MYFLYMITLRNKTVAGTFLPLFNNTNNRLWKRKYCYHSLTCMVSHFSFLLAEGMGEFDINYREPPICLKTLLNHLNSNIHIQILQTDLYTFP